MKAIFKKAMKDQDQELRRQNSVIVKEEPRKSDSDDQENTEMTEAAANQFQMEEDEDHVMDLSSSGSCSWCHKHGPCALEDSGGTDNANTAQSSGSNPRSGRKLLKKFCSERCFGLHRRAMFKKSKRCEWCHTGLNDSSIEHTFCGLNFCSDPCRSRFMAERNTKPASSSNANAAVVRPSSAATISTTSSAAASTASVLQPQMHPQMDQAIWLSRATTALIRAEEERRRQEIIQMLLNPSLNALGMPNLTQQHQDEASNKPNSTHLMAKRRKLSHPTRPEIVNGVKTPATTAQTAQSVTSVTHTTSSSAVTRPPPLTLGPRNSISRQGPDPSRPTTANQGPPPPAASSILPPPTLVLPLPFFIPLPTPIPILIPVPAEKYFNNASSTSKESSEAAADTRPPSATLVKEEAAQETMSDCSSKDEQDIVLDEQRRRRRALIIDKPSRTER